MERNEIWDRCFELAWEAFVEGSIPIGAIILDNEQAVVAQGRNSIYESTRRRLPGKISHAEMNALYDFNESGYSLSDKARECTLYSTMEPCMMCTGAAVFSNIRTIKYAAVDLYAGGLHEGNLPEYIKNRLSSYQDAPSGYDEIQIVMQTVYLLEKSNESKVKKNNSLELWSKFYENAVNLGKCYYLNNRLRSLAEQQVPFSKVKALIYNDLRGE